MKSKLKRKQTNKQTNKKHKNISSGWKGEMTLIKAKVLKVPTKIEIKTDQSTLKKKKKKRDKVVWKGLIC